MAKFLKTKSIYYNDCNLIAQPAHIDLKSRSDIPKELFRIIVSPMDAVVGKTFAVEAARLGLTVCLHRFCNPKDQLEIFKAIEDKSRIYVSIGMNDWDRVEIFKDYTSNWLIDCANGYLHGIKHSFCELESRARVAKLMIGNVHTKEGINLYKEFDTYDMTTLIRVGLAGGAACSTSDATGVNRGQITEIVECADEADLYNKLYIVADGGIKNGNYAAKAFGAGCFDGEMKVKTDETVKNIKDIKTGESVLTHKNSYKNVNRIYKYYYKGKLKIINNIKCTPNHEFYVVNKKYKDIVNENNIHKYAEWIKSENLTIEFLLIKMD